MHSLACGLAVECYIAALHIQATVGPISISKVLATVGILPALILLRKVRVVPLLLLAGVAAIAGNVVPPVASTLGLAPHLIDAGASLKLGLASLLSVVAVSVVVTCLRELRAGLEYFARRWLFWSYVTAGLCLAQAARLAPLVGTAPGSAALYQLPGGVIRAVGLKGDPNFAALLLAIGLLFSLNLKRGLASATLILAGLVMTFSRMGLVLVGIVFVTQGALTAWFRHGRVAWQTTAAAALAVFLGGIVLLKSAQLRGYFAVWGSRVDQAVAVMSLSDNGASVLQMAGHGSAGSRLALALEGLHVGIQSLPVGVGDGAVADLMQRRLGIARAVHDSYLESLLAWGVFTAPFWLAYLLLWIESRKSRYGRAPSGIRRRQMSHFFTVYSAAFLFLSLLSTSLLWLPFLVGAELSDHGVS